jgi:hypothetical protein
MTLINKYMCKGLIIQHQQSVSIKLRLQNQNGGLWKNDGIEFGSNK